MNPSGHVEVIAHLAEQLGIEITNHNRLKEDAWHCQQKLEHQNSDMRNALKGILDLQTRGFITLGDKWTGIIKEALE